MARGCVYLVGAGPGDPELLTRKALRLIGDADVVVVDRLVSQDIQDLIPIGTTRIFAGKQAGQHHLKQREINDLLLRLARSGRRVVRLKGGDPFVFGRGSEEAQHLAAHGIPFEVVPGITAAAGCSAYAGIPLTHRGLADTVRFITGHAREDGELDYDWRSLVDLDCTLVVYMGLGTVQRIAEALMAAGLAADTPAAAIQNGTTRGQRRVLSPIADLAARVRAARLTSPTLVIIGRVVALAHALEWYEPMDAEPGSAGVGLEPALSASDRDGVAATGESRSARVGRSLVAERAVDGFGQPAGGGRVQIQYREAAALADA